MDSVSDVLFSMHNKGVRMWIDNGRLHYQAPKGALTAMEIENLRAMKTTIIEFLERAQPTSPTEMKLAPRLSTDPVPLTYTQLSRWSAFQVIGMGRNTRSCNTAARLSGNLNIDSLRGAFEEIVRRHESLRTRIVVIGGFPVQVVDQAGECNLEIIDLSGVPRTNIEIDAKRLVEELVDEPVDMAVGPLFKARLLKLSNCDSVLVVALDHMITDGLSFGFLMRDIVTLYSQAVQGLPFSLPEMPIQFADFAVWQQKTRQRWMDKHSLYWTEHLREASRTPMSADERIAQVAGHKWAALPMGFEKYISVGLSELSRRARTTLVMSVLTAYAALVLRWSNQKDLVVGFNTTGRHRPEIENTFGFFSCALYLRIEIFEKDSFLDLLRRVTKEYYTAIEHQDFGLFTVPPRPEFTRNASFSWQPPAPSGVGKAIGATPFSYERAEPEMQFDDDLPIYGGEPWLILGGDADGITGDIWYRTARFTPGTMERFGHNLHIFTRRLLQEPQTRIARLSHEEYFATDIRDDGD